MKVIKYAQWALVFLLPMFASTGSAAGIADTSLPAFWNINDTVLVREQSIATSPTTSDNYWTLTGTGSSSFLMGNFVPVGNATVQYQANFNAQGQLITSIHGISLTNYLAISGSLPAGAFGGTSWTAQSNQLLLSANLMGINKTNGPDPIGTSGENAFGFNTHFTGGWAANNPGLTGGSQDESLWLTSSDPNFHNLVSFLEGKGALGSWSSYNNAISMASIPVPAAVWLFGTGLLAVFGGRRKSTCLRLAV